MVNKLEEVLSMTNSSGKPKTERIEHLFDQIKYTKFAKSYHCYYWIVFKTITAIMWNSCALDQNIISTLTELIWIGSMIANLSDSLTFLYSVG